MRTQTVSLIQWFGLVGMALLLSACQQPEAEYLPLADTHHYTYDIQTSHGDNTERTRQVIEITGPYTEEGDTFYLRSHGGSYQDALTRQADGVYVIGDIHRHELRRFDNPALLLPRQPRVGDTWEGMAYSQLLEWRKHALEHANKKLQKPLRMDYECVSTDATVTTPAGEFTNAVRVEGTAQGEFEMGAVGDRNRITIEMTQWYVPDIGMVKSVRRESADTGLLIAGRETRLLQRYR